ncbi:MAG: flippase-like domain-containing protein, partial [Candidatus Bathyarchaeia archaeon]
IVYTNLQCFYDDFRYIGSKRRMLMWAVLYGFFAWLFHLSVFFLTFCALNYSKITSRIHEIIIVYSINMAFQASPISLAPGLTEIVMTNLYILLGFEPALSGTATFLIRIATFWFPIILGVIVAQWIGVKNLLKQTYRNTSTC